MIGLWQTFWEFLETAEFSFIVEYFFHSRRLAFWFLTRSGISRFILTYIFT